MFKRESRAHRMERILKDALLPDLIEIHDFSERHAHHAGRHGVVGGETHFAVKLISSKFEGLSRIERHRLVNALLQTEFETGLHSLTLTTNAPEGR